MAKIAILGFGTVGSGVYQVIQDNADMISRNAGEKIEVKRVLDLRSFPGHEIEKYLTNTIDDIINDDEITIAAEVMGGLNPAYTFVKRLLESGKSVVTSNKELVAAHGEELIKIARDNCANFLFEASVAGGIPILRPLSNCFSSEEILEISGILNGTTNYILTKMSHAGAGFKECLKEAQEYGFAEKDPSADVLGHDPARKLAILASLAWGKTVDYHSIYTEGITNITPAELAYGELLGCSIKLLATAVKRGDKIAAKVAPTLLRNSHPLANVDGVFNGVFVKGNMIGETMFYGMGAGKLPTGSAVVTDIVEAVKNPNGGLYCPWQGGKQNMASKEEVSERLLIRVNFHNKNKAEEAVRDIFCLDEFIWPAALENEFGFISSAEPMGSLLKKIDLLLSREGVAGVPGKIVYYE